MRGIDFSSWNGLLTTLLGLVLVSVVAVGIRLVFMQTIQRRRERENRQINERLRTLIAAYKTLGGSFTGNLAVDPLHLRDQRRAQQAEEGDAPEPGGESIAERRRRTRDAVEAALSDIVLLGTEEQVRLAAHAASEMVAGRRVEVKALVVSLRDFIRQALDLEPSPLTCTCPTRGRCGLPPPARAGAAATGPAARRAAALAAGAEGAAAVVPAWGWVWVWASAGSAAWRRNRRPTIRRCPANARKYESNRALARAKQAPAAMNN